MKRRSGVTPKLRDRWVDEWLRDTERGPYRPFLRTEDVPSSGNRGRIRGVTTGRVQHVMSFNEMLALVRFDHDPSIVDIMEQYPLLPVGKTVAIAQELGIKHPCYPCSRTNTVLTTDFVVRDATGALRAYSVKAESARKKNSCWKKPSGR